MIPPIGHERGRSGRFAYPTTARSSISVGELRRTCGSTVDDGTVGGAGGEPVEVVGRTMLVRDHGGTVAAPRVDGDGSGSERDAVADTWRSAFLRMPYRRDGMARMSALTETFETATTWDRIEELYEVVRHEVAAVIREVTGGDGLVTCRLTHVYPDGAAPYFTVIAAGRRGSELVMWDQVKAAVMDVLSRSRATVTHHHAVGRDHRPGYDRQRPEPFAVALRAAKAALDPAGVLNPGVLIDP